jgi:hypothetical protein
MHFPSRQFHDDSESNFLNWIVRRCIAKGWDWWQIMPHAPIMTHLEGAGPAHSGAVRFMQRLPKPASPQRVAQTASLLTLSVVEGPFGLRLFPLKSSRPRRRAIALDRSPSCTVLAVPPRSQFESLTLTLSNIEGSRARSPDNSTISNLLVAAPGLAALASSKGGQSPFALPCFWSSEGETRFVP